MILILNSVCTGLKTRRSAETRIEFALNASDKLRLFGLKRFCSKWMTHRGCIQKMGVCLFCSCSDILVDQKSSVFLVLSEYSQNTLSFNTHTQTVDPQCGSVQFVSAVRQCTKQPSNIRILTLRQMALAICLTPVTREHCRRYAFLPNIFLGFKIPFT